jgi:hypothetical protein
VTGIHLVDEPASSWSSASSARSSASH